MEIKKAETAGFCFGVANAVNKAFDLAKEKKGMPVFSYGALIHNGAVIRQLEKLGVRTISEADQVEGNPACVLIRAHGVSPDVIHMLRRKNCTVVDATCPFVAKIHRLVQAEYEKGNQIVIVGDRDHPEVLGINGWCHGEAFVVASLEECQRLPFLERTYSVVSQTTFDKKIFEKISFFLKNTFDKVIIFDTICNATSLRQQEARRIASQVDLMIVVGGKESSNTRKLYEISRQLCKAVLWVECADELKAQDWRNFYKVGVTAGASTPDWIIEEVIGIMSEVNANESNVEETVVNNEVVSEENKAVEEVAAEKTPEEAEGADSFATMLEETLTTISSGEIVKGPINKIDSKGVYVDLGFKFEGFISLDEFMEVPGFDMEQLHVGDEVEAMVVKVSDKDGEAILSKRRVDYKKNIQLLESSFENKTPVTVKITEAIKGGVVAFLGTVRIFIPASQLSERFVKDISTYVGKTVDVIITSFEKGPKGRIRIVGSRKIILSAEREEKEEAFWSDMYVGKVCKGIVKSFTPFGAFVDIGGYDGLVHMSELSWRKIKSPADVLSIGQEVEVTVLECSREKKRISLGYRKPEDNPWFDAENLYQVGDIFEVTVVRFVSFGVFVNIADGIDGLVHISQISNQRISSAADCLKLGQKVMAKIIDTNIPEKRINLSIRDVQAYDPEPKPVELDEEGNPVEKKFDRPRKKDRNDRQQRPRKEKPQEDVETFVQEVTSSGTSIGDILAAKMQNVTVGEESPAEEAEEPAAAEPEEKTEE